ncbi:MAG: phospholipid/cholesterol/gamma-HCH transport system permease protein [Solirubrobacteraceae bacterium]|jgi:phospholipid/cholesterol/gamma-HCH transport system permease protein|nr:phospholipid/cholesterol/gamma-HCH transport system permease protein [Solirubrobacteraceae bacterium]
MGGGKTIAERPLERFGAFIERGRGWESVQAAAGMWSVGIQTLRELARWPLAWIPDAVVETSVIFRRTLFPVFVSVAVFIGASGVFTLGKVIQVLGAPDRQAGGIFVGSLREVATWVTMMIFAGVAGSAVTADLGARKIREELDALAVLGVPAVRSLVAPRVAAFTFSAVVLGGFGLLAIMFTDYLLVPPVYHLSGGVFFDSVKQNILTTDVYATIIKHAIIGFCIGVVCCVKGLQAKGGAEGVGRAVNEAVVISFFLVWAINSIYNLAYLSLFPEVSVLKG